MPPQLDDLALELPHDLAGSGGHDRLLDFGPTHSGVPANAIEWAVEEHEAEEDHRRRGRR